MPRRSAAALVLGIALSAALLACDGFDQCEPGECDPCVGEKCALECVDPDDEDVGYDCDLSCTDGADCSIKCGGGVSCQLACDASDCYVDRVDAHCTDGARCDVDTVDSLTFCEASTCDVRCGLYGGEGWCDQACVDGSTCSLDCGLETGRYGASGDLPPCGVSCDASSSCHVRCGGSCTLCCNGSSDCAMECLEGIGSTCEGGAIVCGRACSDDGVGCPGLVFEDEGL